MIKQQHYLHLTLYLHDHGSNAALSKHPPVPFELNFDLFLWQFHLSCGFYLIFWGNVFHLRRLKWLAARESAGISLNIYWLKALEPMESRQSSQRLLLKKDPKSFIFYRAVKHRIGRLMNQAKNYLIFKILIACFACSGLYLEIPT